MLIKYLPLTSPPIAKASCVSVIAPVIKTLSGNEKIVTEEKDNGSYVALFITLPEIVRKS